MNDGKQTKGYPADAYHDVEAANPRVERREKYTFGGSAFNTEWEKQIRVGFIRKVRLPHRPHTPAHTHTRTHARAHAMAWGEKLRALSFLRLVAMFATGAACTRL